MEPGTFRQVPGVRLPPHEPICNVALCSRSRRRYLLLHDGNASGVGVVNELIAERDVGDFRNVSVRHEFVEVRGISAFVDVEKLNGLIE